MFFNLDRKYTYEMRRVIERTILDSVQCPTDICNTIKSRMFEEMFDKINAIYPDLTVEIMLKHIWYIVVTAPDADKLIVLRTDIGNPPSPPSPTVPFVPSPPREPLIDVPFWSA